MEEGSRWLILPRSASVNTSTHAGHKPILYVVRCVTKLHLLPMMPTISMMIINSAIPPSDSPKVYPEIQERHVNIRM